MHCMQYAIDIELHIHTYTVGVADIAARELGSPHNVLHSSSIIKVHCYKNWTTQGECFGQVINTANS